MIKNEKEESEWRLAVERDLVHKEKSLPFRTNQFMLSGDNFTEVVKRALGGIFALLLATMQPPLRVSQILAELFEGAPLQT